MSDDDKIRAEYEKRGDGEFTVLVYRGRYGNGWGIGVDFKTAASAKRVRDVIVEEANRGS